MMNILFRTYSTDVMRGKGKNSWTKFGMQQLQKLFLSYYTGHTEAFHHSLNNHLSYTELQKGSTILKEGEIPYDAYFLLQGSVIFTKNIHGNNHIRRLLSEGNFIVFMEDVQLQIPADTTIRCLENCRMVGISREGLRTHIETVGQYAMEIISNFINQERLQFERKHSFLLYTENQNKIEMLRQNFPGIFERFKMKYISGFAGMQPETMSRVKNKN